MGGKTIKEYFLIKEEKWNCHHFPLFVGQFMCSDYTRFNTTHTRAYTAYVCGAYARTYTHPYTTISSLILTGIKEQLEIEDK